MCALASPASSLQAEREQPSREALFPGGNTAWLGMRPSDTGTMRILLIHKMSVNKLLDMDNVDITKVLFIFIFFIYTGFSNIR